MSPRPAADVQCPAVRKFDDAAFQRRPLFVFAEIRAWVGAGIDIAVIPFDDFGRCRLVIILRKQLPSISVLGDFHFV